MKPVVLALDLAVLALAHLDLVSVRGAGLLRISRECGSTCSLGEPQQVKLCIENPRRRGRRLHLRDDVPGSFTAEPAEFRIDVPGRSRVDLEYRLVPVKRGTYVLERVDALVSSRLGLWARVAPGQCGLRSGFIPTCTRLRAIPCWLAAIGSACWACGHQDGWVPTTSSSGCATTLRETTRGTWTGGPRPGGES